MLELEQIIHAFKKMLSSDMLNEEDEKELRNLVFLHEKDLFPYIFEIDEADFFYDEEMMEEFMEKIIHKDLTEENVKGVIDKAYVELIDTHG